MSESNPRGDFEARIQALEESVSCLHSSRPLCCYDCGRRYEKGPDLHVSNDDWARIAPHDGGGVLCPNCMHDRFVALGVPDGSVRAVFASGPFSVDAERMPEEYRLRSALQAAERERDAAIKRAETAESTAHGLRLLQGTTDEVATGLIRERDEARTALLDLADKAGAELDVARSERDSARLEAGRLAQELVEVTGKLVLAEVEVGRLREAQNVCWHCKDCLLPGPRPRCENGPDECDVEDCDADGCVEDREALEPKEVADG